MIDRDLHVQRITGLLKRFPVVALLGARQVGKTTLAGLIAPSLSDHNTRFDLENPADVARLADVDPRRSLTGPEGESLRRREVLEPRGNGTRFGGPGQPCQALVEFVVHMAQLAPLAKDLLGRCQLA